LLGSVLLTFGLQLMLMYVPALQKVFNTQPLTMAELLWCLLASSIVFHAVELEKFIKHRIRNQPKKAA
jgi:Ca2+-transporting ATPase